MTQKTDWHKNTLGLPQKTLRIDTKDSWITPKNTWIDTKYSWITTKNTWIDTNDIWIETKNTGIETEVTCINTDNTWIGNRTLKSKIAIKDPWIDLKTLGLT